MKKTLAHSTRRRRTFPVRLVSALALLGLMAGLGLFASRPAHTVGGPVAVTVANTVSTVPTDEAAPKQPFTGQIFYVINSGSETGSLLTGNTDITVPAGKRLVVQTVSLYHLALNNETIQAFLYPTTNGSGSYYALPSVPSNGTEFSGTTQPMTVYADGGSTIPFTVYRNQSSGTEYVYFYVSGYLVNS